MSQGDFGKWQKDSKNFYFLQYHRWVGSKEADRVINEISMSEKNAALKNFSNFTAGMVCIFSWIISLVTCNAFQMVSLKKMPLGILPLKTQSELSLKSGLLFCFVQKQKTVTITK